MTLSLLCTLSKFVLRLGIQFIREILMVKSDLFNFSYKFGVIILKKLLS